MSYYLIDFCGEKAVVSQGLLQVLPESIITPLFPTGLPVPQTPFSPFNHSVDNAMELIEDEQAFVMFSSPIFTFIQVEFAVFKFLVNKLIELKRQKGDVFTFEVPVELNKEDRPSLFKKFGLRRGNKSSSTSSFFSVRSFQTQQIVLLKEEIEFYVLPTKEDRRMSTLSGLSRLSFQEFDRSQSRVVCSDFIKEKSKIECIFSEQASLLDKVPDGSSWIHRLINSLNVFTSHVPEAEWQYRGTHGNKIRSVSILGMKKNEDVMPYLQSFVQTRESRSSLAQAVFISNASARPSVVSDREKDKAAEVVEDLVKEHQIEIESPEMSPIASIANTNQSDLLISSTPVKSVTPSESSILITAKLNETAISEEEEHDDGNIDSQRPSFEMKKGSVFLAPQFKTDLGSNTSQTQPTQPVDATDDKVLTQEPSQRSLQVPTHESSKSDMTKESSNAEGSSNSNSSVIHSGGRKGSGFPVIKRRMSSIDANGIGRRSSIVDPLINRRQSVVNMNMDNTPMTDASGRRKSMNLNGRRESKIFGLTKKASKSLLKLHKVDEELYHSMLYKHGFAKTWWEQCAIPLESSNKSGTLDQVSSGSSGALNKVKKRMSFTGLIKRERTVKCWIRRTWSFDFATI